MDLSTLAMDLAGTIRHDGRGGVADDLPDTAAAADWARDRAASAGVDLTEIEIEERLHERLVVLRRAIRALLAEAVSPLPPSRADANRLPPPTEAMRELNATARRSPVARQLVIAGGNAHARHHSPNPDPVDRLLALIAESAIVLLSGPDRRLLRSCQAPRCVRYFKQDHPNQEWCKPSCGNRARAARHYRRQRERPAAR